METVTVKASGPGATTEGSGAYATGSASTATRFELPLRGTPQSVSVVTRTQMDDFGITDINDALEATPGVNVEKIETDRTYYTARGFDVTNFQVDGIGMPFVYGNVSGNVRGRLVAAHQDSGSYLDRYIDGRDGSVLGERQPWSGSAADIFVQAQFPLHSGRILISLMGLVVAMLSVTGVYLWWKKRRARTLQAQAYPVDVRRQDAGAQRGEPAYTRHA
jgi:hypothetical protein